MSWTSKTSFLHPLSSQWMYSGRGWMCFPQSSQTIGRLWGNPQVLLLQLISYCNVTVTHIPEGCLTCKCYKNGTFPLCIISVVCWSVIFSNLTTTGFTLATQPRLQLLFFLNQQPWNREKGEEDSYPVLFACYFTFLFSFFILPRQFLCVEVAL